MHPPQDGRKTKLNCLIPSNNNKGKFKVINYVILFFLIDDDNKYGFQLIASTADLIESCVVCFLYCFFFIAYGSR